MSFIFVSSLLISLKGEQNFKKIFSLVCRTRGRKHVDVRCSAFHALCARLSKRELLPAGGAGKPKLGLVLPGLRP